ncbi:hypothetical protein [Flavobacterium sp.]|uniref:hypothetical protein n=1 Tax=Flavobacterium sp. TaxID=239 RepID=UPI0035276315
MQQKSVNIVSFDNPYPPNYGGVIDVYFKIKALHELGFQVHLHCFAKEIPTAFDDLKKITHSVYFYTINQKWYYILSKLPLSVISRNNKALVNNLLQNSYPILFEGLKTTCSIQDIRIKDRIKILRLHNLEHNYFKGIAHNESNIIKKYFYYREFLKYRNYLVWNNFTAIKTLANFENEYLVKKGFHAQYVPVFHGNTKVQSLSAFGKIVLYHGDLSTSDNVKSAFFLIEIFKKLPSYKLVIASGSGKQKIENKIGSSSNISFEEIQSFNDLLLLFKKAHICISWSFQKSGTKLKLLNALFNSRFSIINQNIIDDTSINKLCELALTEEDLTASIHKLMKMPYEQHHILEKQKMLLNEYNDLKNAQKLMEL